MNTAHWDIQHLLHWLDCEWGASAEEAAEAQKGCLAAGMKTEQSQPQ